MNTPAPGTTVSLRTSYGSNRLARVISLDGRPALLGADGQVLEGERLTGAKGNPLRATVQAWRLATTDEAIDFEVTLRANEDADRVSTHGALALIRRLHTDRVVGIERDNRVCEAIEELRRRNKPGAASQLASFRFIEPAQLESAVAS